MLYHFSLFFIFYFVSIETTKKCEYLFFCISINRNIIILTFILFANTIQDAFAMGVGMHYSQYLALVIPINLRRLNQGDSDSKIQLVSNKIIKYYFLIIILYLLFYSGIMVSLTFSKGYINYYYLIPVFFQLAHFYVDGFIWRFSNVHIRNNVGKYMFLNFD